MNRHALQPTPDAGFPQHSGLLAAAARASRALLETSDVLAAMRGVLRQLGEAAGVDRAALALIETDDSGARRLVLKEQWASSVAASTCGLSRGLAWEEFAACDAGVRLQSGQSVPLLYCDSGKLREADVSHPSARQSLVVPFMLDGVFAGALAFDDYSGGCAFDTAVMSALEIAAGLVGAALHRERLTEAVRHEREQAAEQRVLELARANLALRSNLDILAAANHPVEFFGQMLLATVLQFDAAAGTLVMLSLEDDAWQVAAHVSDGHIAPPPFAESVPNSLLAFDAMAQIGPEPHQFPVEQLADAHWPGIHDFFVSSGHQSVYGLPLVFGGRNLGFLMLAFRHREALGSSRAELLQALGQQLTLAIALRRLANEARHAAVLSERNRIGREIHDGLGQAFAGILMQLGAAEASIAEPRLVNLLTRIRELAREGLAEARRAVLALRPEEARPVGLELALRQLAERSTVPDRATCRFIGGGEPTGIAPEHEHELFRIAQEAVSNALRHGSPRAVSIALTLAVEWLELSISDDGVGMDVPAELAAQTGFGLANMRERAHAIGGEFQLISQAGHGTTLSVRVKRRRRS